MALSGREWDLARSFVTLPKTKNGKQRYIRLNAVALAAFTVLRQRSLTGEGQVFVNIQGQSLRGYKHWFDPAVEESGLRDFTWYCLRHTFASRLAMAGVDILTISELMGHRAIQMTKRYAHLAPAHNQDAVDRLVSYQQDARKDTKPVSAETAATTCATSPERTEAAVAVVMY